MDRSGAIVILEEADVSVVMFGSGMTVGKPLGGLTKQFK